ncbi:hypothetical protein [Ferrimicrobium sp.]|nr:hypothetical protein [Ferrimicrobium sp.]
MDRTPAPLATFKEQQLPRVSSPGAAQGYHRSGAWTAPSITGHNIRSDHQRFTFLARHPQLLILPPLSDRA